MPIYEYACTGCGAAVERLRKYCEREHPLACPSCGGAAGPIMSVSAVLGSSSTKALPQAARCDAGPACCGGGCGVPMN
jgi:putative FmdB family regulatory protein